MLTREVFMNRRIVILGAGDLGREILCAAHENSADFFDGETEIIAFADEDTEKIGNQLEGIPIVAFSQLAEVTDAETVFMSGVGVPQDRKRLVEILLDLKPEATFARVIHRSAVIMPNVDIAPGVFLAPHSTVATGSRLARHVVINQNTSVGHDCRIGAYSVISPGCVISGRTEIGEETFFGSSAVTYPGVKVGRGCTVSALVSVARQLKDNQKLILKPNAMVLNE